MKARFALGCFWHPQTVFDKVEGVTKTIVGYSGGVTENPTYELVCGGTTGHAESIEIEFDENKVSYKELLEIFWKEHDPTTKDRQGPDEGSQYRSVIFYFNDEQKREAERSLKQKQEELMDKIVTEIKPAEEFYPAEEYHQKYFEKK